MHRLRRGNGGVRVAHGGHGDEAALHDDEWFDAEERRFPQHQIGPFADLDAAHLVADAVRNRRVDGEFGDIAFDPRVVMAVTVAGQLAALLFHFVRGLPATHDDFTDAAHGLAVGAEHADRTEVVQYVFSRNRFATDSAFGKRQVFGNRRV